MRSTLYQTGQKALEDEPVEGDYQWDTTWQVIQKMAGAIGADVSNENDPLVRSLRIAVKDDSAERVLVNCEHILASQGCKDPSLCGYSRAFTTSGQPDRRSCIALSTTNTTKAGSWTRRMVNLNDLSTCDSCHDKEPRPGG